jgi:hypothetical protein
MPVRARPQSHPAFRCVCVCVCRFLVSAAAYVHPLGVPPPMLRISDACIARTQSMGGDSQGSGWWRRRSIFPLVPRHSLLSPPSAPVLAPAADKRGSKFKRAPAPTSAAAAACLTVLLMLSAMLSPASAQVVSLSCVAGYFGEGNAVEYNGRVYRTLDGTSPLDTGSSKCQDYYLPLPSGWELAADNADSIYVIRYYPWGTYVMVVAGGGGYWTCCGTSAGQYWNTGLSTLSDTSGSTYTVSHCPMLILISKPGSACTACPAGESEIAGRECGTRMCVC